ncbi:NAD(P)-dependent dehydrogenase (short-subunit alcohol dehydrogenase family) [Aureimonas jatrophae]|nr:NAD(P)-dependent dehydrogenase (short-subunit alcohol dehydrogenase family) [Aureimonas jatrophae]
MTGRTVLITGANKSIGFETARQLGRAGYRIWLGSRDDARGRQATETLAAEGLDVRALAIDVTSDSSVQAAADQVARADGRLDILINNAGIPGDSGSPTTQSVDDIRTVYETNVFGPIRVTQAFLPLLRSCEAASVVMVTSGLGSLAWLSDPGHPFYGVNIIGYNSSKTALNAVTVSLAKALRDDGIRVNAADPGYTATDFNNHSGYRTVEQAAAGIAWLATLGADGPTGRFFFEKTEVPW